MSSFIRYSFVDGEPSVSAYVLPLNGDKELLAYKTLLRRRNRHIEAKVGLFGSSSRLGQAIQAGASVAIPGDMSEIRSPIRSQIYSALTPGGGGGSRLGVPSRQERGYRCPEGFQYGGRFTDSRFSTCGQMLFDIANLGEAIGSALGTTGRRSGRGGMVSGEAEVNPITPGRIGESPLITRAAQIPRVGAANPQRRNSAVEMTQRALVGAAGGTALMVRRDGFVLRPVVTAAVLRTVPDNRNMEGAAYLLPAASPEALGQDELGLLSNTGVTSLQYVLPSGAVLKLQKSRPLTVGERRKLGRTVNTAAELDLNNDPAARLKLVAAESGGGISYEEDFGSISKPNDLIEVNGRSVRRWVNESFGKRKAPKRLSTEVESSKAPASKKISSVAEAVKHLDNNGAPADIAPKALSQALARAKSLKSTKLGNSVTLHERADGKAYLEIGQTKQFEHLGAHLASEVQTALGLKAPDVALVGDGVRRPYLLDHPRNVVGGEGLRPSDRVGPSAVADMTGIAVADWLTDERLRSPATILAMKIDAGDGAMAVSNRSAGFAGMKKAEMSRRKEMGIDDFLAENRAGYQTAFADLSAAQQRLVVTQLDKILQRASQFNWEEYVARLRLDGELSAAELAHLDFMRSTFDTRLDRLKASKKLFLRSIGA